MALAVPDAQIDASGEIIAELTDVVRRRQRQQLATADDQAIRAIAQHVIEHVPVEHGARGAGGCGLSCRSRAKAICAKLVEAHRTEPIAQHRVFLAAGSSSAMQRGAMTRAGSLSASARCRSPALRL
jgi:hypothetical protein